MTKIDAAVRSTAHLTDPKAAAPADPTGLAALFEGMIGQVAAPGQEPGTPTPVSTGAIKLPDVPADVATAEEDPSGSEEGKAPPQQLAEQLLKAIGQSTVGPASGKRARVHEAEGRKEHGHREDGKEKESGDVPPLVSETVEAPIAQAISLPAASLPAQRQRLHVRRDRPGTEIAVGAPVARPGRTSPELLQRAGQEASEFAPELPGLDAAMPAADKKALPDEQILKLIQDRGAAGLVRAPRQPVQAAQPNDRRPVARPAVELSQRRQEPLQPLAHALQPDAPAQLAPAAPQSAPLAQADAPSAPALPDPVEHHLHVAKDGEWLDRLARDIAQASGEEGTSLRFRLHPAHLGSMHVEIARDGQGTSVRLSADTEAGRALLADAQPKLVQEARAQGLRLSETHVDLGSSNQGSSQRHTPAEPQIKTARVLHREEERDGNPTSDRAERYA